MSTSGTPFTDWEQEEADRNRPLLVDEDFSWSEPPARRRRVSESAAKPERQRRTEPRAEPEYEARYEPETSYRSERAHAPEPTRDPAYTRPSARTPEPSYERALTRTRARDYAPEPTYERASTRESALTRESAYAAEPARESSYAAEPPRAPRPRYADQERIDVERELDVAWGGRLSAAAVDTYEVVPSSYAHIGDTELTPPGRRTVVITGRGADRFPVGSRRSAEAGLAFHERSGFNPDRMAMWAVLMGIALLLACIAH